MKFGNKTKTISVSINIETVKQLKEISELGKIAVSKIIQQALDAFFLKMEK